MVDGYAAQVLPARTRASCRSSCRAAAFTSSMRVSAFSGCLGAPAGRFVAGAGSLARRDGLPLAASWGVEGPDGALPGALPAGLGGGRPRGTGASGVGALGSEEARKRMGARATAPGWHDAAPGISRRAERSSRRPRPPSSLISGAHRLRCARPVDRFYGYPGARSDGGGETIINLIPVGECVCSKRGRKVATELILACHGARSRRTLRSAAAAGERAPSHSTIIMAIFV